MIKYALTCKDGHAFEAWFANSATYDKQARRGLVSCPDCGSTKVEKAMMAPSVATRGRGRGEREIVPDAPPSPEQMRRMAAQKEMLEVMRKVRRHVEANAEYVGPKFAEEARKIHHEETEARGIYGEASLAEAKELVEEGIGVLPLPRLPEDGS